MLLLQVVQLVVFHLLQVVATLALAGVSSGSLEALVGGFLAGGGILVLRKLLVRYSTCP